MARAPSHRLTRVLTPGSAVALRAAVGAGLRSLSATALGLVERLPAPAARAAREAARRGGAPWKAWARRQADSLDGLESSLLAFHLVEEGRQREAESVLRARLERCPDDARARVALGAIELSFEELDGAARSFTLALEVDGSSIAALVNRGEVFLRQGRVAQALEDFSRAVALDPAGADPLSLRARMLSASALEAEESLPELR